MRPALLGLALVLCSCGARTIGVGADASDCDPRTLADGLCPGAPHVLCSGTCAVEPDCATVIDVSPTSLSALTTAPKGACARLADGAYPALTVDGVSLYGGGEARVQLAALSITTDALVRVRGVRVGSGGLRADGAGEVVLQGVRVTGATTVSVFATASVSLALDRVTIDAGSDAGLAHACSTDGKLGRVKLEHVAIDAPLRVGVQLCDVTSTLRGVHVRDVKPKDFTFGRALDVVRGSVAATRTVLSDPAEAGMFTSATTATLGPEFHVDGGRPGVALGSGSTATFDGFGLTGAGGAGLVVAGTARATLRRGRIQGVTLVRVPVDFGGLADVGDGVVAQADATLDLDATVSIGDCGRRWAILDTGTAGVFAAAVPPVDLTHMVVVQGDGPARVTFGPGYDVEHRARKNALPTIVVK